MHIRKCTVVAVIAGILIAWVGIPLLAYPWFPDWTARGQFGDLFGSVNALFSGLAFAGVVFAILLQREDLALQRQELELTRKELAKSAKAQEESVDALLRATFARTFDKIHDTLDDEKVLKARHTIYKLEEDGIPFSKWHAIHDWETIVEPQINNFLRAHNIAGIIVRHGYIPKEHIIRDWQPHLLRSWRILEPYVLDRREMRRRIDHSANHWRNYEWLVREAKLLGDENADC